MPVNLLATASAGELLAQCSGILLDASLKGCVVLAVAGMAALAMRRASAAMRHLVWFLAMVALLAVPVLSMALPAWQVLPNWASGTDHPLSDRIGPEQTKIESDSQRRAPTAAVTADKVTVGPEPGWTARTVNRPVGPVHPSSVFRDEIPPAKAAGSGEQTDDGGALEGTSVSAVAVWGAGVWAFGVLGTLVPLALGSLGIWRLSVNSRRITHGLWAMLLRRASADVGLRRPVVLLASDRRAIPMIWGIFRPRILLPAEAGNWAPEKRRVGLVHGLAHVKRWDCLTKLIGHIVCALYWFNPLAWLAFKRLQREAEAACDDLVLNAGSTPSDYAEHIVKIASGLQGHLLSAHSSIAMAKPTKLKGRIVAILDSKRNRSVLTRVGMMAAILGAALLLLPISIIQGEAPGQGEVGVLRPVAVELDPHLLAWGAYERGPFYRPDSICQPQKLRATSMVTDKPDPGSGTVNPRAVTMTVKTVWGEVKVAIDSLDPEAKLPDVARFDFTGKGVFDDGFVTPLIKQDGELGGGPFHIQLTPVTFQVPFGDKTIPVCVIGDYSHYRRPPRVLLLCLGTGVERAVAASGRRSTRFVS
jgi:beta-lactamase regulating signal transducer with metallopeptidase domain